MKLFTHALPAAVVTVLIMLASSSYADDTEIYFARATAENDVNQPKANVLIMLDTSGSMRNCQTGTGSTWCSNINERRITLLHEAMKEILDETPSTVEIGLGRFVGSSGGRILLPVMPVNNLTRPYFDDALNGINQGQNSVSPGNVQPSGNTPTALAYEEMSNYMLGLEKSDYVTYTDSGICVSNAPDQQVCRSETVWSDPVEVDWCDASEEGCDAITRWNGVSFCNVADSSCQYTDWSNWRSSPSCTASDTCQIQVVGWWIFTRTEYRVRGYETREITFQRRVADTVEVCEAIPGGCNDVRSIVGSGNRYSSPINKANQCETNHIILFTDGTPSGDDPRSVKLVSCGSNSYNCQVAIARHLNSESNVLATPIKTHNIGLYMGTNTLADMRRVSEAGGGETYDSDSAESLLEAFKSTLDLIDQDARSISAPGVAVNAMNRFQHLDQLYYSVFQPFKSSYWEGNLKRYRLVDGEIHDVKGLATDPATGYFRSGSQSFWSSVVDGPDVTRGGARERVGASRKLFYSPSAGGSLRQLNWSSSDTPSNTFFGLAAGATTEQRAAVLNELKTMWGDPLHSVPVMVNYGVSDQNNYVFVSTNGGMLHAIDTRTGNEAFAFMPYEFISQAPKYTSNRLPLRADNTRQTYGLDGSWVAWRKPGATAMAAPERVYLYGGMRRGGRNYYALNVTTPTSPSLVWQINNGTAGYAGLGQTWSTPTLTKVPVSDGTTAAVLVVGGGYSPGDHDKHRPLSNGDSMGNMVYFINAENGNLIWSAGGRTDANHRVPDMKWAVPGSISVVDIDFDGIADHMYFGDLGGQVFRVDIKSDGNHEVVRIASAPGSATTPRRFYEAPSVAYVKASGVDELYVAIGSGYRAHPLDERTPEAMFVIRDDSALTSNPTVLATVDNMTNVTAGGLPVAGQRGWYYTFDRSGEKVMSSPVIYDGRLLFTTYAPLADAVQADPCAVTYGRSYLHTVNLMTARPAALTNDLPPPADRSQSLTQSTPAPTPTLIVDDKGRMVIVVGTEAVGEADLGDPRLRKRRWMQLTPDEANSIKGL